MEGGQLIGTRSSIAATLCVAAIIGACDPAERARDPAIVPATSVALSPDGGASTCAVALGARARLQGTVRQRVYAGRANSRDTVWLLEAPAPLPACDPQDTSSDSARRLVQLVPPPPAIMALRDKVGLVVGRMGRAATASHHTPYVLYADSVLTPDLLRGGQARRP